MRSLLYLIGQPAAGKSTLAAVLTDGLDWIESTVPFAHRACLVPGNTVVELGAHRESFSGTDALAMNVQPKVITWLASVAPGFVLGEGDRLGNSKFFQAAIKAGWDVRIAYLALPLRVAEERRLARSFALGVAPQGEVWVRGRITKGRNLAEEWGERLYRLNADRPVAEVAEELRGFHDPVVAALDAARSQG